MNRLSSISLFIVSQFYRTLKSNELLSALAINITGNYTDLQVGSTTDITCQTDPIIPDVTITWYYISSNTIGNSNKLRLSPVTLYDHNVLYKCVLQSNVYPSLENKTINVTVQSKIIIYRNVDIVIILM